MSSSSPVQRDQPDPLSVDDIDEQWEKFAKDGCPDWWLMAKYTHGWLARTFPYVPFKDCAASSIGSAPAASAASPALVSSGSLPSPATAADANTGRSYSSPEVELLQALPATTKASGTAEWQQQQQQQQQQQPPYSRAVGPGTTQTPAAGDIAGASSTQQ